MFLFFTAGWIIYQTKTNLVFHMIDSLGELSSLNLIAVLGIICFSGPGEGRQVGEGELVRWLISGTRWRCGTFSSEALTSD